MGFRGGTLLLTAEPSYTARAQRNDVQRALGAG